jgi:cytochrome c-type biogenesis protein CcmF
VEVNGYALAYEGYTFQQVEDDGNKVRNQAEIGLYRGGRRLATIRPERNLHNNVQGAVTEVALRSNLKEDMYVVLSSLEADGLAAFQVLINPLVVWLWIGGGVLLAGVLVAAWPPKRRGR